MQELYKEVNAILSSVITATIKEVQTQEGGAPNHDSAEKLCF